MNRRLTLTFVLLPALLSCSEQDTARPFPSRCDVDFSVVDFGRVLRPHVGRPDEFPRHPIVITNLAPENASVGADNLTGSVSPSLVDPAPAAPEIYLVPPEIDPTFDLDPQGAASFMLGLTVTPETTTGVHSGLVDLGSTCDPLPFLVTVIGRAEPVPATELSWPAVKDPSGTAVDSRGDVYLVDDQRLKKFTPDGDLLWTIDEWVAGPDTFTLWSPVDVAVDRADRVFVTDVDIHTGWGRISTFDADGNFIRTGPESETLVLDRAWHVDVDREGFVYVTDRAVDRVIKLRPLDEPPYFETVRSWGGTGRGPGQFRAASGLAVSPDGFVYVADSRNENVQKFTTEGELAAVWGTSGRGAVEFRSPGGIGLDPAGNLLVADEGNHRIQILTPAGEFVTDWGWEGTEPGTFDRPRDVSTGPGGKVYVADSGNQRVQRFQRFLATP